MTLLMTGIGCSCSHQKPSSKNFRWTIDRFDDIQVLRYQVPQFDSLPLNEKLLVYYLGQAALCGRDILYDQNGKYNLRIRRTLEAIYRGYQGDRDDKRFRAFEKYLKKVWFANGIHHHYSTDKFRPEFTADYFDLLIQSTPRHYFPDDFQSVDSVVAQIKPIMFDPDTLAKRVNLKATDDVIRTSANNYYEGVTQDEVEAFYSAKIAAGDSTPISYGLNSKLLREPDGQIVEQVWRTGGMYSEAITKIVEWLKLASDVAEGNQKETIDALIAYYNSGDLHDFDRYNILWVEDTTSRVDFVNGFIETYGDALGYKGSWEGIVNFRDEEATRRTMTISKEAQWFEDHSPIDDPFKKGQVKGVSAKVITVGMLGGDCYPATPIGINLPNSDWIRRDYGSKSVTIDNITAAYAEAAKGNGFNEEFMPDRQLIAWYNQYGTLADALHTDLHECLGHGSGQLAPGVRGDELKNYASTLEEARADLFALYFLADPKLIDLGLLPSPDAAKIAYYRYIMNGMMTQLVRIEQGKTVEESHMRNRKLIAEWCYEKGRADRVIERVVRDGKSYIVINDYAKLRTLFGKLLAEIQRIKSTGDFKAGQALVEQYGVQIDPQLHKEVLERYARLNIAPFSGFINPVYRPIMENGRIVDVTIEYPDNYVDQMLDYSKEYSYLPSVN